MPTVPIRILDSSVVVRGSVNGSSTLFVIDTGDAVGPVFNSADAFRLGLTDGQEEGVSGAGGASGVFETTASVTFDTLTFPNERCAIDPSLQGYSLLGLSWFLKKCDEADFDFKGRTLSLSAKAAPASLAASYMNPPELTTPAEDAQSATFPAEPTS